MRISLFMPYFQPPQPERRAELDLCLAKNRANDVFDHIYLMVDDDSVVDTSDGRVTVIPVIDRPTYKDWTELTEAYCPDHISILANADIYFDSTILRLVDLFRHDPTAFVALSRYELVGDNATLHSNPHWSQDTWAYYPAKASNPDRDQRLNFPLGVPRCDNKVAYVFGVYGHEIYNPCKDVRSIHVHETGLRNYDKKGDMRIVGGMAMVHASPSLLEPAPLDIEMWPVKSDRFASIKLNKSLEKWSRERGVDLPPVQGPVPSGHDRRPAKATVRTANPNFRDRNVIAYDRDWQFPAITEQQAFKQVRLLARRDLDAVYSAFPWATMIDILVHNQKDQVRLDELRRGLEFVSNASAAAARNVTVCQHIHMLKFPDLFRDVGVTDIFWSHAVEGLDHFPEAPEIRIHPFPLYPVQVPTLVPPPFTERKHLFSFVGAKANSKYLTQSRTYLIDQLSGDPRGHIRDRDAWHYNRIVYDQQILARSTPGEVLVDERASEEFREVMAQTVFALCPSGTGPNSIRLWEAIAAGSVPVVLSDTYRTPAPPELWDQAVVTCNETPDAVRALPDRLSALLADAEGMRRRKVALGLLAHRYGRNNFVPDVLALMGRKEEASDRSHKAA